MIASRHALFPLIGLCAVLAACSGKADKLSDAEIARMLHTEGLADERVDPAAVDCLRAWADDSSLASGLKAELLAEPGKSDCRRHMQGWLDDGSRNPQGLMFVDVATPKLTQRAMDLLAALPPLPVQSTAATVPAAIGATDAAPAAAPPPELSEADYQERVQVNNSTNQAIDQYETACREAQALTKSRQFKANDLKIIGRCQQLVGQFRESLNNVVTSGNAFEVSMATRSAEQQLTLLRSVIDKKN